MAEIKTKPTDASVDAFLHEIEDTQKREDAFKLVDLLRDVIGAEPVMWGSGIIGFGNTRYENPGGSGNAWFISGFSPRKKALSLYLMGLNMDDVLLQQLGKHKTSKGCLYINKLDDVNLDTLKTLVRTTADRYTQSMDN